MLFDKVYGIAAVGKQGQLGLGNALPWHDPEDLKWFRHLTTGHAVYMGSKTFNSFKTPLRDRTVTEVVRGVRPEEYIAWHAVANNDDKIFWVAGGALTYELFMPFITRWFISRIDYDGPADTFMPPLW